MSQSSKVDKHITIEKRHEEFLQDENLNLSGVVRDRLDELIERYGWPDE